MMSRSMRSVSIENRAVLRHSRVPRDDFGTSGDAREYAEIVTCDAQRDQDVQGSRS
jgi:hypothetical protein